MIVEHPKFYNDLHNTQFHCETCDFLSVTESAEFHQEGHYFIFTISIRYLNTSLVIKYSSKMQNLVTNQVKEKS